MAPLVSIIIPSYNQAQFIEDTIDSIIAQSYSNIEILVMDGGSDDGTVTLLEKYKKKVDNLLFVSEPDKGQTHAINKGFSKARGQIIAWLNSDDIYEPDTVKIVVEAFKKNPDKYWATGYCRVVDINNIEIRRPITYYKNFFLNHYSKKSLFRENFISQPATFWTREAFEKAGYLTYKDSLTFDYEYWLRLSTLSDPIIIDKYLARFRWYETTKSGSCFEKQLKSELKWIKKHGLNPKSLSYKIHWLNCYKNIIAYKIMKKFREFYK